MADYCVSGVGPIFGMYSLLLPGMWACGPCLTSGVTDFNEELVLDAMRLYNVLRFQVPPALVYRGGVSFAVVAAGLFVVRGHRLLLLRKRPWLLRGRGGWRWRTTDAFACLAA